MRNQTEQGEWTVPDDMTWEEICVEVAARLRGPRRNKAIRAADFRWARWLEDKAARCEN